MYNEFGDTMQYKPVLIALPAILLCVLFARNFDIGSAPLTANVVQAPLVSARILSPQDGAVVQGFVEVVASADADRTFTVSLGDAVMGSGSGNPAHILFDTHTIADGEYLLRVSSPGVEPATIIVEVHNTHDPDFGFTAEEDLVPDALAE